MHSIQPYHPRTPFDTRPDPGRIVLVEKDYRPIAGYPFQRWGERDGRPFRDIRPLCPDAARRAWRRTTQLNGAEWDGSLPTDPYSRQDELDLRDPVVPWDEASVRDWLAGRGIGRDERVLACYGPEWVIEIEWGTFYDYWLTFLWVDACVWPTSERWFLRYAGERFVLGRQA